MSRLVTISLSSFCLLALYPAALLLVLAADTWLGDAEFLRAFLYDSKRGAALQILRDWWSALPWCLALWLAVRGLARVAPSCWLSAAGGLLALLLLATAFSSLATPLIVGALLLWASLFSFALDWLEARWPA